MDKAKKEGKTYKAILLVGNLADENAVERRKGHGEVIDANKEIINVVAEIPTEWNHEVALKGLQNALQANPDVNLIITPSDFLYPPDQVRAGAGEQVGQDRPAESRLDRLVRR